MTANTTIKIIHGVHTDTGKTFSSVRIASLLRGLGHNIKPLKPIISGISKSSHQDSDNYHLLKAAKPQQDASWEEIQKISKYLFREPISPNIAGNLNGITIHYQDIIDFCITEITNFQAHCSQYPRHIIIELAGGIMSPVDNRKTMLNLATDIQKTYNNQEPMVEHIIITSDYLGSISHTLTAIQVLKASQLKNWKIIFNNTPSANQEISHQIHQAIQQISGTAIPTLNEYLQSLKTLYRRPLNSYQSRNIPS